MFNTSVDEPFTTNLNYEILDLAKFGRASDDAVVVGKLFGAPRRLLENPSGSASRNVALFIVGDDERRVLQVLQEQRAGKAAMGDTLRPIAVIGPNRDPMSGSLDALADVVLGSGPTMDALREARATLAAVAAATASLPVEHGDRALLLLQFLCSREGVSLAPVVTPSARFAYRYPVAESILTTSTAQAMDVLNDLGEYGLLDGHVVDRVFLCPHCGSYRVPVKELCSECRSPDISMQRSVHHFRCGHVGPETAFLSEGSLRCPKCRAYLRHVGVEYNHPGRIVTCNACNHWAAEPLLQAWCADCNQCLPPDQLKNLRILRFEITPRGIRAARAGRWNPNEAQAALKTEGDVTHPTAGADPMHQRELARTVLQIANANHWKIAAYLVELGMQPAPAGDSHSQDGIDVAAVGRWATLQLGPQALVAPLGDREVLVLGANGRRGSAPTPATLARSLSKSVERQARVSALKAADASALLAKWG